MRWTETGRVGEMDGEIEKRAEAGGQRGRLTRYPVSGQLDTLSTALLPLILRCSAYTV